MSPATCPANSYYVFTLQWRHNEHNGVSITSLTIIFSTVYSGANQRKRQSSASLAFVRGIHRWPVNSLHKGPVTQKIFSFDDVIMKRFRNVGAWQIYQLVQVILMVADVLGSNVRSQKSIDWYLLFSVSSFPRQQCTLAQRWLNVVTGPTLAQPTLLSGHHAELSVGRNTQSLYSPSHQHDSFMITICV